ncbi:putative ribonuclease H-like domain-containing protein, partial [Tanacetum coccineum]
MDVKSAFLYGQIEEEVYVCQPPEFEDHDHPDKVYKVVKALYGLHQAQRAWYETLANYLLRNGFQRGNIDQTLFIKRQKGHILLVQIYVDDIIFGSTKKELCDEFEKLMKDKFQMSSMGELTFFLGLQIQQKKKGIFISQDKYVKEILSKFKYTDVKTASTLVDLEKPLVQDGDVTDVDEHLYRSMIGSLMYLTASRPDIMFAVCACAKFQVSLKTSHLLAIKRIFRYLKGKPTLGLWYYKDSPLELVAYTDSDYAGATQDRKSTTGGCQFLGNRLISWQCKKQTVVATSTTEAEYVAAASCCGQVLWIQNQLLDYGYNFMHTVIYIDNNSTICIIENPVQHSKTKHIEIRHHFIRDCNSKKLIQMVKIDTEHNVADLLTKGFDAGDFSTWFQCTMFYNEALASPEQTAPGKDLSNPLMADSLPKTISCVLKNRENCIHTFIHDHIPSRFITISFMAHLEFCEKHNMVAFLNKIEGSEDFHDIIDFLSGSHISYALTASPLLYKSLIDQFWHTAVLSITKEGAQAITAIVDDREIIISEVSLRRHLKLQDSEGISSLPNEEIFEQLTNMGLFSTMLVQPQGASSTTSSSNISSSPYQSSEPSPLPTEPQQSQPSPAIEEPGPSPNELPLHVVHSHGSDEGSLKLNELTNLVTKLSDRIGVLENDLQKTK